MTRRSLPIILGALLVPALALMLSACQTAPPKQPKITFTPKRVAVLPFQMVAPDPGDGGAASSPLTGSVFFTGSTKPAAGAQAALDNALMDIIAHRAVFKIIPPSQVGPVFQRLRRRNLGQSMMDSVTATGRLFKADAVLVGFIYRFSALVGNSMSAEKPASAAFDLALVRISDKTVVWKNSFDQTQRPLSEDILDAGRWMRHGIRWYKVGQFARIGLEQLMQGFPWLEKTQKQQ
jgi:hypothetical protein